MPKGTAYTGRRGGAIQQQFFGLPETAWTLCRLCMCVPLNIRTKLSTRFSRWAIRNRLLTDASYNFKSVLRMARTGSESNRRGGFNRICWLGRCPLVSATLFGPATTFSGPNVTNFFVLVALAGHMVTQAYPTAKQIVAHMRLVCLK